MARRKTPQGPALAIAFAFAVIPAKAGIHFDVAVAVESQGQKSEAKIKMDSSFRWNDGRTRIAGMRERKRLPCVYLLASRMRGTLYAGVTSDLVQRVWQHKNDLVDGFTKQHGVHILVWHELHETMESAIIREKAIKAWKRAWKIALIESANPDWRDLYPDIL